MSVSPNEFWQLLKDSALVPPQQAERLRAKISQYPEISLSPSADGLAQLLVANQVLTPYQSRILRQGRAGPFRFGDYVVQSPSEMAGLSGWFWAKRCSDSTKVLLQVVASAEADGAPTEIIAETAESHPELGELQVEQYDDCRLLVAAAPGLTGAEAAQPDDSPQVRRRREPPEAGPLAFFRQKRSAMASRARRPGVTRRRSAIYLFLAGFLLVSAAIAYVLLTRPHDAPRPKDEGGRVPTTAGADPPQGEVPTSEGSEGDDAAPYELTDAPDALWARPSAGDPIHLRHLPADVQAIVQVRLASLLQHPEGGRILRSLGADVPTLLGISIPDLDIQYLGIDPNNIGVLTVGLLPQATTMPKAVVVLTMLEPIDARSLPKLDTFSDGEAGTLGSLRIWLPSGDANRTWVIGDAVVVSEIAGQKGRAPVLRRELGELREATHDTDHVTILATPSFLRTEARGLFADARRILLDGLEGIWSDEAQAASFGLQLGEVAFAEMRIIARAEITPLHLANHVTERLHELPRAVSDYVGRARLDPYWQRLAVRFPSMVRFVVEQSRVATEGRQVAVTVALPQEAVHNLLLATELALASPVPERDTPGDEDHSTWALADVLEAKISFSFSQQSLAAAVEGLADQVRAEFPGLPFPFHIEIRGSDLQAEGITRNQQIREFRQVDQPVHHILTSLVLRADGAGGRPSASGQQLVWIALSDGESKVLITTRSAADKNDWPLPHLFREE